MWKRSKRIIIFISIFFISCLWLIIIAYRERLITAWNQGILIEETFNDLGRATGILNFSLKFVLINILITTACLVAEACVMGWKESSLRRILFNRSRSTIGDIWCWLLGVFYLYNAFVFIFSFGAFYLLSSLLVKNVNIGLLSYIPFPFLQFLIVLLLSDLKHYIRHYFMHRVGFLWALHQYHHSAREMNMITTDRGHFIEAGIISIFDSLLFVILGAPPQFYIGIEAVKQAHLLFSHSKINWDFGWVGRYIIVSPKMHVIHHSTSRLFQSSNYGNLFVFWDRLFNTWMDPKKVKGRIRIGLKNGIYNRKGFFTEMLIGFKRFLEKLFVS